MYATGELGDVSGWFKKITHAVTHIVPKAIRKAKILKVATLPVRLSLAPTAAILGLKPKVLGLQRVIKPKVWKTMTKVGRIAAIVGGAVVAAPFAAALLPTTAAGWAATAAVGAGVGSKLLGGKRKGGGNGAQQYTDAQGRPITKEQYDQLVQQAQAPAPTPGQEAYTPPQGASGGGGTMPTPDDVRQAANDYFQRGGMSPDQAAQAADDVATGKVQAAPEIQAQAAAIAQSKASWIVPVALVAAGIGVYMLTKKKGR